MLSPPPQGATQGAKRTSDESGGGAVVTDGAAIVEDDLSVVETTFELARTARRRVRQNIGLAFAYNVIAIPVALVGLFNSATAAIAVAVCGGILAVGPTGDRLS